MKRRKTHRTYLPKDWDDFLNTIEIARKELDFEDREECFFRGHAQRDWTLLPTLFRHAAGRHLSVAEILELEGDLFWEFQARAQELHHQTLSDWDYLFFMRHHGVYTRVLDWTESFGVALYFALERHRVQSEGDGESCVWLLNPYALNQEPDAWEARDLVSPRYLGYLEEEDDTWDYGDLIDLNGFHWKLPVAIYPIQRSNRVRAQRGWFTVQGISPKPLEVQAPQTVAQVVLPGNAIGPALRFLEQAGLNEYTMYADLDALGRELHRKIGLTAPVQKRSRRPAG